MNIRVNNSDWNLRFVEPCSDMLKRSDGSYTLGVTDGNLKCVFIADNLSDFMTRKVICHELCHVFCISYEVYMSIDEEERLAKIAKDKGYRTVTEFINACIDEKINRMKI